MDTRATKRQKSIPFSNPMPEYLIENQVECKEWMDSCFKSIHSETKRGYICIWHRPQRRKFVFCDSCRVSISTLKRICFYCGASYCSSCFNELRQTYGIVRQGDSKWLRNHWPQLQKTIFSGLKYCPLCADPLTCHICRRSIIYQADQVITRYNPVCNTCTTLFTSTRLYLYRLLKQFPIGRDMIYLIDSFVY